MTAIFIFFILFPSIIISGSVSSFLDAGFCGDNNFFFSFTLMYPYNLFSPTCIATFSPVLTEVFIALKKKSDAYIILILTCQPFLQNSNDIPNWIFHVISLCKCYSCRKLDTDAVPLSLISWLGHSGLKFLT